MLRVQDLVRNEVEINEETRDKLAFLNSYQRTRRSKRHATEKYGNDVNSTGSFLSDLSVTQSEDDLLDSQQPRWRKHRPSYSAADPVASTSFIGTKRSRISVDGKHKSSINSKFVPGANQN